MNSQYNPHLLDNSIFAASFSPESILSIIGESEKGSDLVLDLVVCLTAPHSSLKGSVGQASYLAQPSWFHLGQSETARGQPHSQKSGSNIFAPIVTALARYHKTNF